MYYKLTSPARWPLVRVLQPRQYALRLGITFLIGLVAAVVAMRWLAMPLWAATLLVMAALLPAGIAKWRDDAKRFGWVVMLIGVLFTTQALHTIEHIAQWMQYHWLLWTARQASGIVSPADAEWVHFIWNSWVFIAVVLLFKGGLGWRNPLAWVLLLITLTHAIEHSYTFVRHLLVLDELKRMGVTNVTAQGLPGIIGRDGWLARSPLTQGTFLCSLPGLTTAIRLDVHFWWNVIEMTFLTVAAHVFLRRALPPAPSALPR
jgi:hypothetical protein